MCTSSNPESIATAEAMLFGSIQKPEEQGHQMHLTRAAIGVSHTLVKAFLNDEAP